MAVLLAADGLQAIGHDLDPRRGGDELQPRGQPVGGPGLEVEHVGELVQRDVVAIVGPAEPVHEVALGDQHRTRLGEMKWEKLGMEEYGRGA